jgi:hypothetical protein
MDTNTTVVCVAGIVAAVCLAWLLIIKRGDFEIGGRAGTGEFFLKAKQRKK